MHDDDERMSTPIFPSLSSLSTVPLPSIYEGTRLDLNGSQFPVRRLHIDKGWSENAADHRDCA